jgi:hypothetical protein
MTSDSSESLFITFMSNSGSLGFTLGLDGISVLLDFFDSKSSVLKSSDRMEESESNPTVCLCMDPDESSECLRRDLPNWEVYWCIMAEEPSLLPPLRMIVCSENISPP